METEQSDEKGFWMIHVDGGNAPNVRHYDKDIAITEAERLARDTKRTVYVLYAVEGFKVAAPPVVSFRTL